MTTIQTRRDTLRKLSVSTALASSLASVAMPAAAADLPDVANVAAGAATFTVDGATVAPGAITGAGDAMNVSLGANSTVINWNGFNIVNRAPNGTPGDTGIRSVTFGAADTTTPTAVLNRVTGGNLSDIQGTLGSTGNISVWLVNPNGIMVGGGANINVGSLVLSGLDIDPTTFVQDLTGPTTYTLAGAAASSAGISVAGGATITTASGPHALVLVAPQINATGTFNGGTQDVAFVTASDATLSFTPGSPLSVTINQGTVVPGTSQFVGGTVSGRNVLFALASQAAVTDALLQVDANVTATGGPNGIRIEAGADTSGAPTSIATAGGNDTSGAADLTVNGTLTEFAGSGPIVASASDTLAINNAAVSAAAADFHSVNAATVAGGVGASGTLAITGSSVTLGSGAAVTQQAAGNVTITSTSGDVTGLAGLTLRSTGGDIAINTAAGLSFAAGTTIGAAGNVDITTPTAASTLSLGDVEAAALRGQIAAGGFSNGLARTGALTVGDVTLASTIALRGNGVTAGVLTANGATSDVTLDSQTAGTGAISTAGLVAGRDVIVGGIANPASLSVTGAINATRNATLASAGLTTIADAVSAGGNYSASGTSVVLGNSTTPVTQSAAGTTTITASSGTITDAGTVTLRSDNAKAGALPLTLTASGNITLDTTTLLAGASSTADTSPTSNLLIRSDTDARSITLGDVTASTLGGAVGAAGFTVGLTRAADLTLGNIFTLADLAVQSSAAGNLTSVGSAKSANGSVVLTGFGSLSIGGAVSAAGDVALQSTGAISASNANVTAGDDIAIRAAGGTIGQLTAGGGSDVTSFADTVVGSAQTGAQINIQTTGLATGAVRATTVGAGVTIAGAYSQTGPDVSIRSDGFITIGAGSDLVATRDIVLAAGTTVNSARGLAAGDDVVIRGVGTTLGAVTSGTGADAIGAADTLYPALTLTGGDIDIDGGATTIGAVDAVGANSDVRIAGAITQGAGIDLSISAGGAITLGGAASARDIALGAGGAIGTAALTATDDIAIRASGAVTVGALSAGTGTDAAGAADALVAADTVPPSLAGNDIDIAGSSIAAGVTRANGAGSDVRFRGAFDNGASDVDVRGDTVSFSSSVAGRDVAIAGASGVTILGATTASDDVVISASGGAIATGAIGSGSGADVSGAADTLANPAVLTGGDIVLTGTGVTTGAINANGTGSDVTITGPYGSTGSDIDIAAGGSITLDSATLSARDVLLRASGGPLAIGSSAVTATRDVVLSSGTTVDVLGITAGDDIVIRGTTITTGALSSGTGADAAGGADTLFPALTLSPGGDIDVRGTALNLASVTAQGAGSDITLDGALSTGSPDINLVAGGRVTLLSDQSARDIAIQAGGGVSTANLSATDDIVIRAGGTSVLGNLTSGANPAADASGAADTLAGSTLSGFSIDIANTGGTTTVGAVSAVAAGPASNVTINSPGGIVGATDLSIAASGTIALTGTAEGRDVALNAGGSVTTGLVVARDDLAAVAGTSGTISGSFVAGGTTMTGAATEANGAADALLASNSQPAATGGNNLYLSGGTLTIDSASAGTIGSTEGGTLTLRATNNNATVNGALTARDSISVASSGLFGSALVAGDVAAGANYSVTGKSVTLGPTLGTAVTQQARGTVSLTSTDGDLTGRNLTLIGDADGSGGEPVTLSASGGGIIFAGSTIQAGPPLVGGDPYRSDLQIRSDTDAQTLTLGDVSARNLLGAIGAAGFSEGVTRSTGTITFGAVNLDGSLALTNTGGAISGLSGVSNNDIALSGATGVTVTGGLFAGDDVAVRSGGAISIGSVVSGAGSALDNGATGAADALVRAADGIADASVAIDGHDVDIATTSTTDSVQIGPVRATGANVPPAGSDIRIRLADGSTGTIGGVGPNSDLDLDADANVNLLGAAAARDVALRARGVNGVGGAVTAASISADDDIVIRASTVGTGALTSGLDAAQDNFGAGDTLVDATTPPQFMDGGDIDVTGTVLGVGRVVANGTGSDVRFRGAVQLGSGADLDVDADTVTLASTVQARDVAINARGSDVFGTSVRLDGAVTAGDDVVVRGPGTVRTVGIQSGATGDASGAADTLIGIATPGQSLAGSDIDIGGSGIVAAGQLNAVGAGSDVRLRAAVANGADDVDIRAGGDVEFGAGASGRDIAVSATNIRSGTITAPGDLSASDDLLLAASNAISVGTLISGAGADVSGAADTLFAANILDGDTRLTGATIATGAITALGVDSDIVINGAYAATGPDVSLDAGGLISAGSLSGRDVALRAGGSIGVGDLVATDDIVLRAGGSATTGTLTAGGSSSAGGEPGQAGDQLAALVPLNPAVTLAGNDIDIVANGVTIGAASAVGAGSDVRIDSGSGAIRGPLLGGGNGIGDVAIAAGNAIRLTGAVEGRDVVLSAGTTAGQTGTVDAGAIRARDDVVVRGTGAVTLGPVSSGTALTTTPASDGAAIDVAGAADTFLGATLTGNDLDVRGASLQLGALDAHAVNDAAGAQSDLTLLASAGQLTLASATVGGTATLTKQGTTGGLLLSDILTSGGNATLDSATSARFSGVTSTGGSVRVTAGTDVGDVIGSNFLNAQGPQGDVIVNVGGNAAVYSGSATRDFSITSTGGASSLISSTVLTAGRDFALNAIGGTISVTNLTAGDDVVVRAATSIGGGRWTSGTGGAAGDAAGVADALAGRALAGGDIDARAPEIVLGTANTTDANGDLTLTATSGALILDDGGTGTATLIKQGQTGQLEVRYMLSGLGNVTIDSATAARLGFVTSLSGTVRATAATEVTGSFSYSTDLRTVLAATGSAGDVFVTAGTLARLGNVVAGRDFAATAGSGGTAGSIDVSRASAGDIALNAVGGSVAGASLTARDDLVIRAGTSATGTSWTSGAPTASDTAGVGDALAGATRTGGDLDVSAASIGVDTATATGAGSDIALTATAGQLTLGTGQAGGAATLTKQGSVGELQVTTGLTSASDATVDSATAARLASVTSSGGAIRVRGATEVTGIGVGGRADLTAGAASGDVGVTAGTLARLGNVAAGRDLLVTAGSTAAGGNIDLIGASGRDLALNAVGGNVLALTLNARDDIVVRAGGRIDGSTWTSAAATASDAAGTADTLAGATLAGGDIDARGATIAVGTATANGTGGDLALTASSGELVLDTGSAGGTAALTKRGATGELNVLTGLTSGGDATIDSATAARLASVTSTGGSVRVTAATEVTGRTRPAAATLATRSAAGDILVNAGTLARLGTASAGRDLAVTSGSSAAAGSIELLNGSGRDIALNAVGSRIDAVTLTATDDLVIRAGTSTAGTSWTSGGGSDAAGVGDALAGATLAGGDIDARGTILSVDTATANGAGSDLSLAAGSGGLQLGTGSAGGAATLTKQGTTGELTVATRLTSGGDATLTSATAARLANVTSSGGSVKATAATEVTGTGTGRAELAALGTSGSASVTAGTLARLGTVRATRDVGITAGSVSGGTAGTIDAAAINAGGTVTANANGLITLGTTDAGGAASFTGTDLAINGKQTAGTRVTFRSQSPANAAVSIGDTNVAARFNLSETEINLVSAPALAIDAGSGDVAIGKLAIGSDAGRTQFAVLTTGAISITGPVSGSGTGRSFRFGGAADGAVLTAEQPAGAGGTVDPARARQIRVVVTQAGGGRLSFGGANVELRGAQIGVGQQAFLDEVFASSDVAGQFVNNAASSLYSAPITSPYLAPTYLTANTLTVRYGGFALFQNSATRGQNGGVVLGTTPAAPTPAALRIQGSGAGSDFALFGTINGIEGAATAVIGPTQLVTQSTDPANSRVNGCIIGTGTGCLTTTVAQAPLNTFDPSRLEIFTSSNDFSIPFDPVVASNNEALFAGISSIDVPITSTECPDGSKSAQCAGSQETKQ